MKISFRYRYDRLQEELIKRLADTDVKMRIRANRSIEFAKKWYPTVDDHISGLRFENFHEPVIRIWNEPIEISENLYRMVDKNIPFIIEKHDDTEWIVYEKADVETVVQIESDLGLYRIG